MATFHQWLRAALQDDLAHLVYCMYGEDQQPLYVGYTEESNFYWRMRNHYNGSAWVRESVVEIVTTSFETKEEALRAEGELIGLLQPMHNKHKLQQMPTSDEVRKHVWALQRRLLSY